MMDLTLMGGLVNPAVLFFFFGLIAVSLRSTLEIPAAVAKMLSLYLLIAIGLRGGSAIVESGFSWAMIAALASAAVLALVVPLWSWLVLRRLLGEFDAVALAACCGSVSAATFVAATSFLDNVGVAYGDYMTVALVVMETPAIIAAFALTNRVRRREPAAAQAGVTRDESNWRVLLHDAFTNDSHLLLLASMVIGMIVALVRGDGVVLGDFVTGDVFKGALAIFLLDMGLRVGERMRHKIDEITWALALFGICAPVVNAGLAMVCAAAAGLGVGDAALLCALAASASYIVVPAVVSHVIPEANPGVYFTVALGLVLPFNLLVGIPLYHAAVTFVWGGW